ncbi:MAG: SCO family protein [Bacteroidetes bacterium]|jgi:protein SCO1|nr:SCO family protein [Bacteroidota bacterium]
MKGCVTKGLIVFLFTALCIGASYYLSTRKGPLPVIGPRQVNPLLVDESLRNTKDHLVSGFRLLDQEGAFTDSTFVSGRIHVADFFFTTCQTICPIMSGKMGALQEEFAKEDRVRFLSFSVLPEQDSVPVLKSYAQAYGIPYSQWRLLTGQRDNIYALARKSYFTLKPTEVGKGDGSVSDFIHTNNFVLVDGESRVRGYYDGTSDRDMERLKEDIKRLLKEEED